MGKYEDRIVKYLQGNGVVYVAGGGKPDLLSEANNRIDASDETLLEGYRHDVRNDDRTLGVIFIALIIVFIVAVVKMIQDLNNTKSFLLCVVIALLLVIMMHNVWKDRYRTQHLLKILPELDKKERLKVTLELLKDQSSFNINPIKTLLGLFKKSL
jgi:hypothetical protein